LPEVENVTVTNPLKVAVVGRPNVGKSSYINRLLRNDRVIVSNVPGTTRDSIEIPFVVGQGAGARHYLLIDTAGLRKQGRTQSAVDLFSQVRTEKSIARADVVILMLDAQDGPTAKEKRIAASIIEKQKGCLLFITKWDLAEEGVTQRAYGKALRAAVPFLDFVPTIFLSSESGFNIRKTIEAIDYVGAQVKTVLPTSLLNRILHEAFERVSPQAAGGRRLNFYYATQVGTQPIRIRLFVNDPKRVMENYKTYLVRFLRERLGLEGAPVQLQFRARRPDRKGQRSAGT
jgi:GTP-binding protein